MLIRIFVLLVFLCPRLVGAEHLHFDFVGFATGMMAGDAGLASINQVCKDDFGPTARLATTREFVLSPIASAPPSDAWVHRALDADFDIIAVSPSGDKTLINCWGWNGGDSSLIEGMAIKRPRGFQVYNCTTTLRVACSDVATPQPYHFVGFSTDSRQGHLGYPEMHGACQADFGADARMATDLEYLQAGSTVVPSTPAWVAAVFIDGRSVSNAIRAIGSTVNNQNADCRSWSLKNSTISGTAVDVSGGFVLASCDGLRPVACSVP